MAAACCRPQVREAGPAFLRPGRLLCGKVPPFRLAKRRETRGASGDHAGLPCFGAKHEMTPRTDLDLAHFRRLLERERRRLTAGIEAEDDTVGDRDQDERDQGSGLADREVAEAVEAGFEAELDQVEAALARLESGAYGSCVRCAAPIPSARLEVLPSAALCMACTELTV
jgi:DnaK suppressor protein